MIINMHIGGTEKALLNLINKLPRNEYEITILMLEKSGGFLNHIPEHVNIEIINSYSDFSEIYHSSPYTLLLNDFKKRRIIKVIKFIGIYYLSKIVRDRGLFLKYLLNNQSINEKEYDIAIAFAGPMDLITYFIIYKIKSKRKVQWIHFDVAKIFIEKSHIKKMYKKMDKIFIVSNEAKNNFIKMFPKLEQSTDVVGNIISKEHVINLAEKGKGFDDNFYGIRILTVGRLSSEKGQDMAINVLKRLLDEGYSIKWYCLGEGNSRRRYEELIQNNQLENNFILLGQNPNPYKFIRQCDIYVQPSRHEGFCITLAEAKLFNKPNVTTNFTGASEQIIDGMTGLIVDIDVDSLYLGVKKLLDNESLRNKFTFNLSKVRQNVDEQLKKFKNII